MLRFRTIITLLIISICVTFFATTFLLNEFLLKPYKVEVELYKTKVTVLENEIKSLRTAPSLSPFPTILHSGNHKPDQQNQVVASLQQTQAEEKKAAPEKKATEVKAAAKQKAAEKKAVAEKKAEERKAVAEQKKAAAENKAAAKKKAVERKVAGEKVKPLQQTQKNQVIIAKRCVDIGRDNMNRGDYRGAIKLYSHAIEKNPNDILCYRWLGDAYFNQGDKKQAIKEWKEAAKLGDRIMQSYLDSLHVDYNN